MRRAALLAGLVVLGAAWFGPLPGLASQAFAAHMVLHMAVVAVAAPLVAAGVAGRPWDPVRRAPRLFAPIPTSVLELVVVWGWHAPALHHFARASAAGFALEQAMFVGVGLLLWLSVLGGAGAARRGRAATGVVALILTSVHMTLLGALLALTPRALYHAEGGLWGLTTLEDQHLGGAIMLLVGGIVYLAGGVALAAGLLGEDRAPARPPYQTT